LSKKKAKAEVDIEEEDVKEGDDKAPRSTASVLAGLRKAYKDAVVDVDTAGDIQWIVLDSPQLNFIFGGGFAMGRVYEFFGPESGGKSTLATYIGSELQRKSERNMVMYLDFEYSFSKKYAATLGLQLGQDKFILAHPLNGEQAFVMMRDYMKVLPIGLIILDSAAAMPSANAVDDAFKANFGATAAVFSNGLRYLNPYLARTGTSLIIINQERAVVGNTHGPTEKTTGGYAIKFYSSWRGRITRCDEIVEKGSVVGIVSRVRNHKNKMGNPKRVAELSLKFASGFDADAEYLQFIVSLGIVKQGGAWFSNEDWGMKVKGGIAMKQFFDENPEIFKTAKALVDKAMLEETEIDRAIAEENASTTTLDSGEIVNEAGEIVGYVQDEAVESMTEEEVAAKDEY
jgi:recombination protein RecA